MSRAAGADGGKRGPVPEGGQARGSHRGGPSSDDSYPAVVAELYRLGEEKIDLGTERISSVASYLGSPQDSYPTVLVGGTNGKGSVVAYLASILRESGCRTGSFLSPHLISIRERIQVNGEPVAKNVFVGLYETVKKGSDETSIPLTFFEYMTLMGYLHFRSEQVDLAVIEVGLGGRFDSTNIINPLLSIITNIGGDHFEFLGNRLTDISFEKAGIIKEGGILITHEGKTGPLRVIEGICRLRRSDLIRVSSFLREIPSQNGRFEVLFRSPERGEMMLSSPLLGDYEIENLETVVRSADFLAASGFNITRDSIKNGVAKTSHPGRFQILQPNGVTFVLDGAHNLSGMRALAASLRKHFKGRKFLTLFGCMRTKESAEMLGELRGFSSGIIPVEISSKKALRVEELEEKASAEGHQVRQAKGSLSDILDCILQCEKGPVLVCGSLYLVGDILALMQERGHFTFVRD